MRTLSWKFRIFLNYRSIGLTAVEIAKSSHHTSCYDLLDDRALKSGLSKSSEEKKCAKRIRKRRKNGLFTGKEVGIANEGGGGGGEDTGDDILEGIFESSEEEQDSFSLGSKGAHSNANAATRQSKSCE